MLPAMLFVLGFKDVLLASWEQNETSEIDVKRGVISKCADYKRGMRNVE